jgi:hypothetical protein
MLSGVEVVFSAAKVLKDSALVTITQAEISILFINIPRYFPVMMHIEIKDVIYK